MKNIAKSKAGLALVATAAIGLCFPAYATPPAKYRHGGQQVQHSHRAPAHRAPERHQRHDRDSGGSDLGILLGIAAIGALIIASQADDEPVSYGPQYGPRYVPQAAPPPVYGRTAPPPPVVQQRLPEGYWYYCAEAHAYYPQIQHCDGGWRQIAPSR